MSYFFRIDGPPVPKGRPRAFSRNGLVRTYTPKTTQKAEEVIRKVITEVTDKVTTFPLKGPLRLRIVFLMPVPKSWSKKKRESTYGKPHEKKPDIDNLIKLVMDALNGLVYEDDSSVVDLRAMKLYAGVPRTDITIEMLNDEK